MMLSQLRKKIRSYINFTICTVLNWLITMQLRIQVIVNNATAYPTVQLHISTFRRDKAIQNDNMTTVYHPWYHDVVTTSYTLLHPDISPWVVDPWVSRTKHPGCAQMTPKCFLQWYLHIVLRLVWSVWPNQRPWADPLLLVPDGVVVLVLWL